MLRLWTSMIRVSPSLHSRRGPGNCELMRMRVRKTPGGRGLVECWAVSGGEYTILTIRVPLHLRYRPVVVPCCRRCTNIPCGIEDILVGVSPERCTLYWGLAETADGVAVETVEADCEIEDQRYCAENADRVGQRPCEAAAHRCLEDVLPR